MAEGTTTTKEALKKLDKLERCLLQTFQVAETLALFSQVPVSGEAKVTKGERSLTRPTCRHIVPLSERGVAGLQSDFHIHHLFEIQDCFQQG